MSVTDKVVMERRSGRPRGSDAKEGRFPTHIPLSHASKKVRHVTTRASAKLGLIDPASVPADAAGNRRAKATSAASNFAYDDANRRTSVTLPNGVAENYSYDAGSELTGISYTLGANTLGNLTYGYDLAGRRTSLGGTLAQSEVPLPVSTATYNADNQLTQWGTANLYYDANGNMTSDGTNSYVWDARNHLASMDLGQVSFSYDGFGRRVAKTVSGTTTNYLHDGANIVQELSGTTVTANLLTGLGVDERFTRTDSNGTANFLTDALGSTTELTDNSGNSLATYAYEPFGNTTVTSGSSANPYQYTGRENDGTGLYYYRGRFYSPNLQRFASEDPIGFRGGINRYAYVANSPMDFLDPSGLERKNLLDRTRHVNRCAATLSQAGSVTNILGVPKVLGSNTIGDIAGLLTGPEPGMTAVNAGLERVDRGLAAATDLAVHSLPTIASHLGVGTVTSISVPISSVPGIYNPVTVGETTVTLSDTALGEVVIPALEDVLSGKVLLDAGTYIGALYVCSEQ